LDWNRYDICIIEEQVTISKKEYEELLFLRVLMIHLQEEIRLLKNGKKSGTSHTPPSHDIGRSNEKSLREKTGKKTGGQKGHKGFTLHMKEIPDEIIDYKPTECRDCGEKLNEEMAKLIERKQEIIIPPLHAHYVEHRSFTNTCTHCNCVNTGQLPPNLKAPIQYGANVSATLTYLFAYQHMPYLRMKILMNDLFKIQLSQGTISNILEKMTEQSMPIYNEIQVRIQKSKVVGGDETGTKINGVKGWFHVWQNAYLTFIVSATTRGYKVTEEYFIEGFSKAVYVSDCWSAQLKTIAKRHQLCLAHLLRELTNFEEALSCKWSTELKILLKQSIELKQNFQNNDYLHPPPSVAEIEHKLDEILLVDYTNFHPKTKAFVKRLIKRRESVFTFLYYKEVPFDNNGSERAIRNIKVKNKISGCFRSEDGAKQFAVLRSVIDTTIKNTQDVFHAINLIAKTQPE